MRVEFHAALCVQQREKLRSNSTANLKHVVLRFGDLCEVLQSVHLLLKVWLDFARPLCSSVPRIQHFSRADCVVGHSDNATRLSVPGVPDR